MLLFHAKSVIWGYFSTMRDALVTCKELADKIEPSRHMRCDGIFNNGSMRFELKETADTMLAAASRLNKRTAAVC